MKNRIEPKINEENLVQVNHLDCDNYESSCFENVEVNDALESITFMECKFHKVTFTNAINKVLFMDCIFDHCDFSNLDMQENVFRRVKFMQCRFTGTDMSSSTLQDTLLQDCEASYFNASGTTCKTTEFIRNRFVESYFNMIKHNNLKIQECNLVSSEWLNTKFEGLDLSDSLIDGILVNAENLKGVIVNSMQAIELAKLLGIIVK